MNGHCAKPYRYRSPIGHTRPARVQRYLRRPDPGRPAIHFLMTFSSYIGVRRSGQCSCGNRRSWPVATRCRCTADRKDTAATPANSAACLVLIFRIRDDTSSTPACRSQ